MIAIREDEEYKTMADMKHGDVARVIDDFAHPNYKGELLIALRTSDHGSLRVFIPSKCDSWESPELNGNIKVKILPKGSNLTIV